MPSDREACWCAGEFIQWHVFEQLLPSQLSQLVHAGVRPVSLPLFSLFLPSLQLSPGAPAAELLGRAGGSAHPQRGGSLHRELVESPIEA